MSNYTKAQRHKLYKEALNDLTEKYICYRISRALFKFGIDEYINFNSLNFFDFIELNEMAPKLYPKNNKDLQPHDSFMLNRYNNGKDISFSEEQSHREIILLFCIHMSAPNKPVKRKVKKSSKLYALAA